MNSILKAVLEEKWAFVAYAGLRSKNTSRWYKIQPGIWSYKRYLMEAYGLASLEHDETTDFRNGVGAKMPHSEYVRGFVAYSEKSLRARAKANSLEASVQTFLKKGRTVSADQLVELKSTDWLHTNMFVYAIRTPMAYGGRPYVPLEENTDYVEASAEDSEWSTAQRDMLRKRHKYHVHVADSDIVEEHAGSNGMHCKTRIVRPPKEYECALCGRKEHHFERSCMMVEEARQARPLEDFVLPFGPNKFADKFR